jgi:cytochrome oxidase assembly protein ShyY1
VYRFLLTPRWLGILAGTLALATAMSMLGLWQLDRYQQRSEINDRIDAGGDPAPLERVLAAPAPGDSVGAAPPAETDRSPVTVTGRYDPAHQVLVRGRTVQGRVGYEVLTPLVLADGSAVLVDRGWIPPAPEGMSTTPAVPVPPGGVVTLTGRVRPGEGGGPAVERRDGVLQTRRIDLAVLAAHQPHRLYGAYLLREAPSEEALTPVPVRRENAWLNAGYAVQWWIFAGLVLAGYAWLAGREARPSRRTAPDPVPAGRQ